MKPFTRLAVVILWLIALPQLLRFIAGWETTTTRPTLSSRGVGGGRWRRGHTLECSKNKRRNGPVRGPPSRPLPPLGSWPVRVLGRALNEPALRVRIAAGVAKPSCLRHRDRFFIDPGGEVDWPCAS